MSNREFEIRSKIEHKRAQKSEITEHKDKLTRSLNESFVLTFLLYLAFTVSLYLGNFMQIKTLFNSFGETLGFAFYLIIAALLAFVLARIKHLTYVHSGLFGHSMIIVVLLIVTGVTFESFQMSAQQDMKATKSAENSKEYQAAIGVDPLAGLNTNVNTDKLAYYEGKLAEHKRYKESCRKTCAAQDAAIVSYTAKIKVERERIEANSKQTTELAKIGMDSKQASIDHAERKGYNLMARAFADFSGSTIAQGVAFLMIIVSTLFEFMHFWASLMRSKVINVLEEIEGQLIRLYVDYQNETGTEYGLKNATTALPDAQPEPTPAPPTERFNWQKIRAEAAASKQEKAPELPAFGGAVTAQLDTQNTVETAPITQAKAPLEQPKPQTEKRDIEPEEKTKQPNQEQPPTSTRKRSSIGFTADLSQSKPVQTEEQSATKDTNSSSVPLIATRNTQAKHAGPNTQTTNLKHAENTQPETRPNTQDNLLVLRARTQKHAESKHAENTQNPAVKHADTDGLLDAFIAALKSQAIKPTAKVSRTFVQRKIAADQKAKETPTLVQCGKMAKVLMRGAAAKKVLLRNPKTGNNQPDYILNPIYGDDK